VFGLHGPITCTNQRAIEVDDDAAEAVVIGQHGELASTSRITCSGWGLSQDIADKHLGEGIWAKVATNMRCGWFGYCVVLLVCG